MMLSSDGMLLVPSAMITGLAFGSISTIVPLICRRVAPHKSGTVYAISKLAAMMVSNIWVFFAGKWADEARGDALSCVGVECYKNMWIMVLSTCIPIMTYLFFNLIWVMRTFGDKKAKDGKKNEDESPNSRAKRLRHDAEVIRTNKTETTRKKQVKRSHTPGKVGESSPTSRRMNLQTDDSSQER